MSASLLATALYVSNPAFGNPAETRCEAAKAIVAKITPLAKGEVAAFQVQANPKPLPDLIFAGPDGAPRKLSDFRGKTLLLNLWATWCAPCRAEMPALDVLQVKLGDTDFEVVAINIDTRNPDKPKQFLSEVKATNLAYYSDASAKIFQDLRNAGKAIGMPTTLLIDAQGCELGVISGPADWASEDAQMLVRAALGK